MVNDYDWESIIQAVPDYDPEATAGDCWFDEEEARRRLWFFEHPKHHYLRHVEGNKAGDRFELTLWERSLIANAFGWKRPNGLRRYRTVWLYVARKNGKSTLTSGCMISNFFQDDEPGAQLYSCASTRKQAGIIWRIASQMIKQDERLNAIARTFRGYKSIERQDKPAWWRVLPSDAETQHGLNVHAYTGDEIHAHKKRDLYDAMHTGMISRSQPIEWLTTTADWDRPSLCNELLDYGRKVQRGVIEDDTFLPFIYQAKREDDWTSEEVWRKANPNLNVTIPIEAIRQECRRAQDNPAYTNTFKRLHLNIVTGQATQLISMEQWDACAGAIAENALYGASCFGAYDLSTTTDITAWLLFFPQGNKVLCRFFLPENTVGDRPDFVQQWVREGWITATPGDIVDYNWVRNQINEDAEHFGIQLIGYDPWNATHLATELGEQDGLPMMKFRQGYKSMNEPTKHLLGLLKAGQLQHGGNPVLRWMASNVAAQEDPAGNLKPHKGKSSDRIDGIVALIMCIGLAGTTVTRQAKHNYILVS